MKLWYTSGEMPEARQEAEALAASLNAEIPIYINGDVKVRMAWRQESVIEHGCFPYDGPCILTHIPEAELLINGDVVKRDLLELIALDIYALEMEDMRRSGIMQ